MYASRRLHTISRLPTSRQSYQVDLFRIVCMGLLAAVTQGQDLQSCSIGTRQFTVGSAEDAAALAASLGCSNGDFAVQWVGEVFVTQAIHVTKGTSLNITGTGPGATAHGRDNQQLFVVDAGSRLHLSDIALEHGNAAGALYSSGGAIYANQSRISFSGNMSFSFNSANHGGAISAYDSVVSWDGDDIQLSFNSANDGGAIAAFNSAVSWRGDNTQFISNVAQEDGGAIYAYNSTVSWDGDGAQFSSNAANEDGGTFYAERSTVSWDGDGVQFISNSANQAGGAIYAFESKVFWNGDRAKFASNSARGAGGAILAHESDFFWVGDSTQFSLNSAEGFGGAINAAYSAVSWGRNTTFHSNVAGKSGGALASSDMELLFFDDSGNVDKVNLSGAKFINNSAVTGGALHLTSSANGFNFTDVIFQNNSATNGAGGAVAAYAMGTVESPLVFSNCHFVDNAASETGGAVEILTGQQEFSYCHFKGNSADVGGALRLGGSAGIRDCFFFYNVATTRGLAVAVVGSANISGSSFDGNLLSCALGSYQSDTEKEDTTARFDTVCFDCPDWNECLGCTITRESITPTCEAPLEHTSAEEPGVTLETLNVDGGYWRATTESKNMLACYNADACVGGKTGTDNYCASEYTGPYCAVCEPGHSQSFGYTCSRCSPSRRQMLMATALIVGLGGVYPVVKTFRYLLSTDLEEGSVGGCFNGCKPRDFRVQAFKIVVVMWQILTQFAQAAQVVYPSVYQSFMSFINIFVNFDLGSVLAAGCYWTEIDFHDRLIFTTLGPLIAVGVLAMTFHIATLRNSASGDAELMSRIRHKHQTALLLLTFLIYSSASSTVLETFACETLDDGIEYLRADYRIICTDAKHKVFEVYAGIMVVVYPIGIPVLYAALLFPHHKALNDAGADKAAAQPIADLWKQYKPGRHYYEVVECMRRILLTGVVVFIFPNDAAQIAFTMLITFVFLLTFEVLAPYASESDMWLSRAGHVIVFLSMFYLLAQKVDVSSERDQSRPAFGGVFVACHVLMVLVIVAQMCGVVYCTRPDSESEPRSTPTITGP